MARRTIDPTPASEGGTGSIRGQPTLRPEIGGGAGVRLRKDFSRKNKGNQSAYPHVLFISVRQAHCRCLFPAGTEITPESPPSAAIHLCTIAVGSRSG